MKVNFDPDGDKVIDFRCRRPAADAASNEGYDAPSRNAKRASRTRDGRALPAPFGASPLIPILFLVLLPASPGAELPAAWDGTVEQGREAAAGDGKPILLLLPSARPQDLPAPLADPAGVKRASARMHLVRARADDIEGLIETLRVTQFPALFLLDSRFQVFEKWEGAIPQDLWVRIDRALRRLASIEEEIVRAIADAREALRREDFPAALDGVRRVRSAARGPRPEVEAAGKIEETVMTRAEEEIRKAVAVEGLEEDARTVDVLEALRSRFPIPAFRALLDVEILRIRSRPIGGKSR